MKDTENTILYGIIDFDNEILCAPDSLGSVHDISIGNCKGSLSFPFLPEWNHELIKKEVTKARPWRKPLVGPVEARKWVRGDEQIYWGAPISYPVGTSEVKSALLKFLVKNSKVKEVAEDIHKDFSRWFKTFDDYTRLLTKQRTSSGFESLARAGSIELLKDDGKELVPIPAPLTSMGTIYIQRGRDMSLHLHHLEQCCSLASSRFPPRLEYQLLLKTYDANRNNDYRNAIIEGAVALEVALTNRIQDELESQEIHFGDDLLKRFRMLSGRFELARLIGVDFPDKDYKSLILEPRNNVVHRASFPTKAETYTYIREIELLFKLLSPKIEDDYECESSKGIILK